MMLTPWVKRVAIGIAVIFVALIAIGYIVEQIEKGSEQVEKSSQKLAQPSTTGLCPVANTSTSFCIVKDGKPYYFAIEGWELPTIEEVKNVIGSHEWGLYIWLKVRTNLDLQFDADNKAYVLIGELYKEVLYGDPWFPSIRRGSDVVLLPYDFSAWREDIEALLRAEKLRLYFDVDGYRDILPTSGCVGEICFILGHHGPGFYVNFTPPPTTLKVLDVEGRCVAEELCLYNVTFELRDGYIFIPFGYDHETGRKSKGDFPIHINVYVMKDNQLIPITEYFPSTVIPPLPPTAIDVWKEPEHEYLTTIIPPGTFTLVFKENGAIYPQLLFNNTPIAIGTPWGVAKFEPKLEVVEVVSVGGIAYWDKVVIDRVNVTLRNSGRIPVVIPSIHYYIPPNYMMLKGELDGTDLVFVAREMNTRWGSGLSFVVNPGETVTVSLVPLLAKDILSKLEPKLIPEDLVRDHVVVVESIYTNTSGSIVIPALKLELRVQSAEKARTVIGGTYLAFGVRLAVTNTWVLPVDSDWVKVYFDHKPLETFYYDVTYESVDVGETKLVNVSIEIPLSYGKGMLYEVLAKHQHLRVCLGASCVEVPLSAFTYRVGEEVVLGDLAIKVLNMSTADVVGVRYRYWGTEFYRAPQDHTFLVMYIEMRNRGIQSTYFSLSSDDVAVVTRTGAYELAYLRDLPYAENISSAIIIDSSNLWNKVDARLRPGESCVVALIFVVPKDVEIRYILFEKYPYVALFSVVE